jgi:hypothetical protein
LTLCLLDEISCQSNESTRADYYYSRFISLTCVAFSMTGNDDFDFAKREKAEKL